VVTHSNSYSSLHLGSVRLLEETEVDFSVAGSTGTRGSEDWVGTEPVDFVETGLADCAGSVVETGFADCDGSVVETGLEGLGEVTGVAGWTVICFVPLTVCVSLMTGVWVAFCNFLFSLSLARMEAMLLAQAKELPLSVWEVCLAGFAVWEDFRACSRDSGVAARWDLICGSFRDFWSSVGVLRR
jgi:hypothetical protein